MAKRYELHLSAENEDWMRKNKKEDTKKKKSSVDSEYKLRNEIIKLAYEKPELRDILMPLIKDSEE